MKSLKYIWELDVRFHSLGTWMKTTQYFKDRPCNLLFIMFGAGNHNKLLEQ